MEYVHGGKACRGLREMLLLLLIMMMTMVLAVGVSPTLQAGKTQPMNASQTGTKLSAASSEAGGRGGGGGGQSGAEGFVTRRGVCAGTGGFRKTGLVLKLCEAEEQQAEREGNGDLRQGA